MIELLIASTFATALSSTIVGQSLIGSNLLKTEYLTPNNQVITIQETISEDPNTEPCNL